MSGSSSICLSRSTRRFKHQEQIGERIAEEMVEVPKIKHQEQLGERIVKEIVETPRIEYQEQSVECAIEQVTTVPRHVDVSARGLGRSRRSCRKGRTPSSSSLSAPWNGEEENRRDERRAQAAP